MPVAEVWIVNGVRTPSGRDDLPGSSRSVRAATEALNRAGIGRADLSCVELNEAFAAQALACLAEWPALEPEMVNPQGGAIALGRPLGCPGAHLLTTLAWRLQRSGGQRGLATMCIGVGQGIAVVLERAGGTPS